MRRFSLLALIVGIVLIPLAMAAAAADHAQRIDEMERTLAREADAHAAHVDAYFDQARATALLTANQAPFSAFLRGIDQSPESDVKHALGYLGRIYPNALGVASVVDAGGRERARVLNGAAAPERALTDASSTPFFYPTFDLRPGEVHQAQPYLSTETGEWAIANSAIVPGPEGEALGLVQFELTVESFRQQLADVTGADNDHRLVLVDRGTGSVVVDAARPQRLDKALGLPADQRFASLTNGRRRGVTRIEGRVAAFRPIKQSAGNANDWLSVAVSHTPPPSLAESASAPVYGALGLALLLLIAGSIGLRAQRRELVHAAHTDTLTGLPNRRRLAEDLQRATVRKEESVLLLFDLNGFKSYNDAFGHLAGDALLARLGENLAAAVRPAGRAYRLGGDEFCVLASAAGAGALQADCSESLSEQGEGFSVSAAWGSVLIPQDTTEPREAMRLADQRMYAAKRSGRPTAERQSKDVLLRALAERHPDLGVHLNDVAGLAETVAHRLGLSDDEALQVRHAAELHDIGKVAIPDRILMKPEPLDDSEWAFMRQHTIIGERIIAGAPSLAAAGRVVRASHERWDGAGYPDGIAGSAIPLGARIISVCDAFDAITSKRPYDAARSPKKALEELARCAGTQFDPAVVEAFTAVWWEREAAASVRVAAYV